MKTKNIFKTVAFAMLMPTMLLTTSCSSEDDLVNNTAENTETVANKGYALPVTVNVSRQGDEGTRATYDGEKKKLSFSAGDKLFVAGDDGEAGQFAGTLDYDAVSGKFSGTVTTQEQYTGTIDDLMASASAILLPAGYESYGFYSVSGSGYEATLTPDYEKAFALTKAAAVEQFSFEYASSYSSGFALTPGYAIVSFTISGLTANKKVDVSFEVYGKVISGNVTTSAEGDATFALGLFPDYDLEDCALTVDGNNIAMPTKTTEAGHIYNISRSAAAAAEGHALSASAVGEIVGTDGKAYAVEDKDNLPTGVTAAAMVAYKSATAGSSLAIALADEGSMNWATAKSTCEGKTAIGVNSWKLPSQDEWKQMFGANGGNNESYTVLNSAITTAGGTALQNGGYYWSSTESDEARAYRVHLDGGSAYFLLGGKYVDYLVRSCLAF